LNEEESLPELVAWIERVMQANNFSYEVIMIDDGSTDDSWEKVLELSNKNTLIKGIRFQRNYGKSAALNEGFKAAHGDIVITSDNRIKNNINDINSKKSLDLISKINPKSFKYIDFVEKGDKNNYGFIAQDINEIIPDAVGYKKENIPNIFKLFNVKDDIIETTEDLTSQLSINDNIKIINKDNKEDYKILEISSNHIKIDKKIEEDKCFIYGKEIDDFHILDKDIIFTLNVSATQELNKKIKKQKKKIKKQKDKMKEYDKIIKERRNKLKEQQKEIDLLFELLANK
jgi:glycosyltransferase involved in cell wall biosynthesis